MPFINHNTKQVFYHVPKTGGSSMRDYLYQQGFEKIGQAHGNDHHLLEVSGYKWDLLKYESFAYIRNPWDLAVSDYFYKKHQKQKENTLTPFVESFSDYIREPFCGPFTASCAYGILFDSVGKLKIDKVYMYEKMDLDVRTNITPHRLPYKEMYNEEDKEIVYNLYKGIIKLGNYEF